MRLMKAFPSLHFEESNIISPNQFVEEIALKRSDEGHAASVIWSEDVVRTAVGPLSA
jgi:hypothetical protein